LRRNFSEVFLERFSNLGATDNGQEKFAAARGAKVASSGAGHRYFRDIVVAPMR
jgi:hypothetical protein